MNRANRPPLALVLRVREHQPGPVVTNVPAVRLNNLMRELRFHGHLRLLGLNFYHARVCDDPTEHDYTRAERVGACVPYSWAKPNDRPKTIPTAFARVGPHGYWRRDEQGRPLTIPTDVFDSIDPYLDRPIIQVVPLPGGALLTQWGTIIPVIVPSKVT